MQRNSLLRIFLILLALSATSAAHAVESIEEKTIALRVGEQETISAAGVQSYSEGAPGVVDVRLPKDGRQFVVVAMKPGKTSLLLIFFNGKQIRYTIDVHGSQSGGQDITRVTAKSNVRLDFYFVELSETSTLNYGINWPASFGHGVLNLRFDIPSFDLTQGAASISGQALPFLDLAQVNGWGRVLRHAVVITANGTEARFNSGGEFNIPVAGSISAEIRTIPFGTNVGVTPLFNDDTGRIELRVQAELTNLTSSASSSVPGRTVTNLNTVANLELGDSLVLAGLDSEDEAVTRSGLPGLSQIPILGVFFGSTAEKRNKVKNYLVIIPTVTQAVPLKDDQGLREALKTFRSFHGDVEDAQLIRTLPYLE